MTQVSVSQPYWLERKPYYEVRPTFFPFFVHRNRTHQNNIGASVGELGLGKTYWYMYCFEYLTRKHPDLYAPFSLDQVVFTPEQFWAAVDNAPEDLWTNILWDDPTRGLSHRDWYMDLNKTVTSFIQTSSRYKKKNLGFALPAFGLLDKAVRSVTTFEAIMQRPGLAKVHKIKPNRFGSPELWKPFFTEVKALIPRIAGPYENKRRTFTDSAYLEREFAEKGTEERRLTMVDLAYSEVKKHLQKYLDPQKNEITVMRLMGDPALRMSEKVARGVYARLVFSNETKPLPSTNANVSS